MKIVIKKDSKTAEIFNSMMEKKDEFRRAVEAIAEMRNPKTKQSFVVKPV